ncbi:MAG TPA: class I SAM-dependent methyltransferase [Myxococcota bacterium]|nr:class I SAM-dependent methyltransferase [Myxococcota bacterium]
MSLYSRYVLPRMIDGAMSSAETARVRAELIPRAQGVTLELGIGSGLNLPFYSSRVTRLYGVDPSAELHAMARKRAEAASRPLELFLQSAEDRLPLQDRSVDSVVCSWSLCSIPDPVRALREARRVLRPSGELLFVEHGRAPAGRVRVWQDRLNPLWRRFTGGCNMNRPTDELIRAAGFEIAELEQAFLPGPKLLAYTYRGRARALSGSAP